MVHLKKKKIDENKEGMIHFILLNSYFIFLFAVIMGVFINSVITNKIFSGILYQDIGIFMLLISSIIIYWAQKTSSNYKQRIKKNESMSHFEFGPYKYLRSPTHFGLFIMTLGFSFIINSFFSVLLVIVAHAITKMFFLKKEEDLLEKKYGQIYNEYKKKVKNWI